MSKLFNTKPNDSEHLHRNNFDLSYQTNLTARYGRCYPVYKQFCIAGQSLNIKPEVGLRSLAMQFPTQTRQKAYLDFYKMPVRYVWDGFQEFMAQTDVARAQLGSPVKNDQFPWLKLSEDDVRTGGLQDFLGLPTTYATAGFYPFRLTSNAFFGDKVTPVRSLTTHAAPVDISGTPLRFTSRSANVLVRDRYNESNGKVLGQGIYLKQALTYPVDIKSTVSSLDMEFVGLIDGDHPVSFILYSDRKFQAKVDATIHVSNNLASLNMRNNLLAVGINKIIGDGFACRIAVISTKFSEPSVGSHEQDFASLNAMTFNRVESSAVLDAVDGGISPFTGDNPAIRISAIDARVYTAIGNAFYRNSQVDPYILDGFVEYEKFCPTSSGKDTHKYGFFYKNWEEDVFTSMHPSAQFGDAPLVGLTTNSDLGTLEVSLKQPQPHAELTGEKLGTIPQQKEYHFTPVFDPEDERHIIGWTAREDDVPNDLYSLIKNVKCGFTLNDLRNASALQNYLEKRIRSNFRYLTAMKDVYGTDVSPDTLKMPEYLGGYSYDLSVNTITNMASGEDMLKLGDFAGNETLYRDGGYDINCYCNEHSIVMGILTIVPTASYSQLLDPSKLVPASPLDWFTPQFANIGKQPIYAKYLTPLQEAAKTTPDYNRVVGYQRPWWQHIQHLDEIHGGMRNDFLGFSITRIFGDSPVLNSDFVRINPTEIVTPFADDTLDYFLGQLYFHVTSKMPLPVFDTIHL